MITNKILREMALTLKVGEYEDGKTEFNSGLIFELMEEFKKLRSNIYREGIVEKDGSCECPTCEHKDMLIGQGVKKIKCTQCEEIYFLVPPSPWMEVLENLKNKTL